MRHKHLPDLTIIRHAEAEINQQIASLCHDSASFTDWRTDHLNWQSPLTDNGVLQAQSTGKWLYHQLKEPERYVCSPLRRTRQTAGHMGLEWNEWYQNWEDCVFAREKHFGSHNSLNSSEAVESFLSSLNERECDPVSWKAEGGGEDFFSLVDHAEQFLSECAGSCRSLLLVTSSGFIWALRTVIERLEFSTVNDMLRDRSERVGHCDVLQYSSEGPGGSEGDYLSWKRYSPFGYFPPDRKSGWQYLEPHQPITPQMLLS